MPTGFRPVVEAIEERELLAVNVLTYHYNVTRTGWNAQESILTSANVNVHTFGKLFALHVDGKVDAQPLYMSGVKVPGKGTHNVLFVATEHDSVYAFDANRYGAPLWHVSMLGPGEVPSDDHGCPQISPEIGITSTPVIDPATGTMYVVAMSKLVVAAKTMYIQRVHALDVTTGADSIAPVIVHASFPGTGPNSQGGRVTFDPGLYAERTSLLLTHGVLYTFWTSHCDAGPYNGWIMGYDAGTLHQVSDLCTTPNGVGGAFWNAGAGAAIDAAGNIYDLEGNGTFDTTLNSRGFPAQGDFGGSFVKISTTGGLHVADYFVPHNIQAENDADQDLGSGGVMVLPNMKDAQGRIVQLAIGAGKDGNIYLVNRNAMGKFSPSHDRIYQELIGPVRGGEWATSAYFPGSVYFGPQGGHLMQFTFHNARLLPTPTSQTTTTFVYPGTSPSVSSNGLRNAIVWAAENGPTAALHAYVAQNLGHELYNSNQAGTADHFGAGNKFITPMLANGKVYVGTTNGVAVFGLLPRRR
jgi:hypothetical protein